MTLDEPAAAATSRAQRDEARRRRALAAAQGSPTAGPRRRSDDRPPAPWGSFPLSELCVLLAFVIGIAGLVVWGERGRLMVLAAMALGSLAGLELSIREHFAGYRSHTTLLAGFSAFAVSTAVLVAAGPSGVVLGAVLGIAVLVFVAAFYWFRQLFKSRSGGLGFR